MPSEFETLMLEMNKGFDKVYDKVDGIRTDFSNHIPVCLDKFADINLRLSVRNAVNGEKQAQEEIKRDWGQWFVRLTMGSIAVGALVLLWKLLTGGAKIVMG